MQHPFQHASSKGSNILYSSVALALMGGFMTMGISLSSALANSKMPPPATSSHQKPGVQHIVKKQVSHQLTTTVMNPQGKAIGQVTLTEAAPQGVMVSVRLNGLSKGWHGFHLHETGTCTPPDFKSAGGHFNPEHKSHGFISPDGSHLGDLPNVYVDDSGEVTVETFAEGVTLTPGAHSLLDENGSALVIHEKADDYRTDPAGDAGSRVGCGVIATPFQTKPVQK